MTRHRKGFNNVILLYCHKNKTDSLDMSAILYQPTTPIYCINSYSNSTMIFNDYFHMGKRGGGGGGGGESKLLDFSMVWVGYIYQRVRAQLQLIALKTTHMTHFNSN